MKRKLIAYLKNRKFLFSFGGAYLSLLLLNLVGVINWLPTCIVKNSVGVDCLGCGINRSILLLLQGDIEGSILQNPLGIIILSAIIFFLIKDFSQFQNKTINNQLCKT